MLTITLLIASFLALMIYEVVIFSYELILERVRKDNPSLVLIMIFKNQENTVESILRSVMSFVKAKGLKGNVIVLDACSSDSTPKILEKLSKNMGFILWEGSRLKIVN